MIALVIATIIATAAVTVPLTYLVARRPKSPMPARHRALLGEAMGLLHQLLHPTSLDQLDTLSDRSREAADRLLTRYNKEIAK